MISQLRFVCFTYNNRLRHYKLLYMGGRLEQNTKSKGSQPRFDPVQLLVDFYQWLHCKRFFFSCEPYKYRGEWHETGNENGQRTGSFLSLEWFQARTGSHSTWRDLFFKLLKLTFPFQARKSPRLPLAIHMIKKRKKKHFFTFLFVLLKDSMHVHFPLWD